MDWWLWKGELTHSLSYATATAVTPGKEETCTWKGSVTHRTGTSIPEKVS